MREIETGPVERCMPEASAFGATYKFAPERWLIDAKAAFRAAQEQEDETILQTGIEHLEEAVNTRGVPWACLQLLGELLIESRTDPGRGGRYLQQAEAQTPRTAEGWYLRSLATLERERAVEYALRAVRLDPAHVPAWERLALLYADKGDEAAARNAAAHVKEVGRGVSCAIEVQAHVLLKEGRYQEAMTAYTNGIAVNPYSATCYRERALAHVCLQQFEQAVADYRDAIRLCALPNVAWARYHRATALWILGRYDEARADYDFVRDWRGKPSFADARRFLVQLDLARSLAGQGQADQAKALAREARDALEEARRAAEPDSWEAAILDCLAGLTSPADLVAAADTTNPEAVCESLYYAGEVCLLGGRTAEAREFLARCVKTDLVFDRQTFPPDPMNEFHLARWRLSLLEEPSSAPAAPDDD
jgi:tetratricopeptide (TPR) repeat protein